MKTLMLIFAIVLSACASRSISEPLWDPELRSFSQDPCEWVGGPADIRCEDNALFDYKIIANDKLDELDVKLGRCAVWR